MHVLTLIAPPAGALTEVSLRRIRRALGAGAAVWIAPEEAADMFFSVPPTAAAIAEAVADAPVDAILQPAPGRRKQLLVADMDSTIVTGETLDELALHAGRKAEVAAITRRSMNGEIGFDQSLRERVAMLRGLTLAALPQTWSSVTLTPGAAELVATMRAGGAVCALVSGGFSYFTERVAARLGFDHHRGNTLLDDGQALTGALAEPILGADAKVEVLRALAAAQGLALAGTLAVGDGANDLPMLRAAGLGVAYHAKPIVASAAEARVEHSSLRALLFAQGYAARDIVSPPSAAPWC